MCGIVAPLAVWVAAQLVLIAAQNILGGAFFVPARFRRRRHIWKCSDVPDDTHCVICLGKVKKSHDAVITPCGHIFHGNCLTTWIDVNPICPLDRVKLRSFELGIDR
jgi:hypothetical protein